MEAEFRQDLCKRTLVVKKNGDAGSGFREKMVLKNSIRGTAKVSLRYLNGEAYYSYEMGSCQTLKNVFDGKPMSYKELSALLSGILKVSAELSKYLLEVQDLIMEPEYIFWDLEKEEPLFCYYPENSEGEEGFSDLGLFLMDAVDKDDEEAASSAYEYFDRISEGIFLPGENFRERECSQENPEKGAEDSIKRPESGVSAVFEGDTDALAPDNIWSDDDGDNYYLEGNAPKDKEEKKGGSLILFLSFIPAIISAGAYAFIFMNPEVMDFLALKETDYIRFGAGVTILSGAFITFGIFYWHKKKKEEEDRIRDMQSLSASRTEEDYRFDELEEKAFEFAEKESDSDCNATVILSDFSGGRRGREPSLSGRIGGEEKVFRIERTPYMIGKMRNKADGVISEAGVSRLHACIREEGGRYYLSDLNSTNGTAVNERRLKGNETTEIFDGDMLRFAGVSMTFRLA